MDEPRKWFVEMKSTLGEAVMNIVKITKKKKDLEYYTNFLDKAIAKN